MGIPYINKWLREHNFINDLPADFDLNFDTLYVDGTQILYYINNKINEATTKEELKEIYLAEIEKLIRQFEPTSTVFISIEGACPVAKFQTQRKRNFQNLNENDQESVIPDEIFFKVKYLPENADVDLKYLIRRIENKEKLSNIKTKRFIYSGKFKHKEKQISKQKGERKFFDYFREAKNSKSWKQGQRHLILSNDNDLIFLALQYMDEDFTILKFNDENNENPFSIVNVNKIREYLIEQIRKNIPEHRQFKPEKTMKDIIGLSFLLGNDFIPTFPDIKSNFNPDISIFDKILSYYYKFNSKKNSSYKCLIENNTFSVFNLGQILSKFFGKDILSMTKNSKTHKSHKQQNYNSIFEKQS